MNLFKITRTDINKVVVRPYKFKDEEAALAEYLSCLMLVGIVKMSRAGEEVESLGHGQYKLSNGWTLQVSAV